MRLLAIALLALLPGDVGAVAIDSGPVALRTMPKQQALDCPRTAAQRAFDQSQTLRPRKLAELPPANAYAAVFRHDGKCEWPLVIKYGVGER